MEYGLLGVALLLLSLKAAYADQPYECQEEKVSAICSDVIAANPDTLPGLVRLTFHDCVGDGGCNGCVDLSNGDNAGLKAYMDRLEDVYVDEKIRDIMTRADFWVLCSHVALREGQRKSGKAKDADSLSLNMVYGRKDCDSTNPDQEAPTDAYPSPHGDFTATTDYFKTQFDLMPNETIALLGAHTLGRARPSASGFNNQWVDGEFMFDNAFYVDILNKTLNWTQVDLDGDQDSSTSHLQWSQYAKGNYKNLMFSSDMCLAYDIEADANGRVNETIQELTPSPGNGLVQVYAADNAKWLSDFSVAYRKMVKKVSSDITLLLAKRDGDSAVCQEPTQPPLTSTTSGSTANASSWQLFLWLACFLFASLLF